MRMDVGVDADAHTGYLAQSGQTVHAFSPSRDGTWSRSATEARQDCDETRPAPLTPSGQAPDQASSSNRAGPATTSGQVAPRHEASHSGGHTRGHQPTAQHHQAANAILTVISPSVVRPTFTHMPMTAR